MTIRSSDFRHLSFHAHIYALSSRFSSLRKRQSVPCAMIFCGVPRISPPFPVGAEDQDRTADCSMSRGAASRRSRAARLRSRGALAPSYDELERRSRARVWLSRRQGLLTRAGDWARQSSDGLPLMRRPRELRRTESGTARSAGRRTCVRRVRGCEVRTSGWACADK